MPPHEVSNEFLKKKGATSKSSHLGAQIKFAINFRNTWAPLEPWRFLISAEYGASGRVYFIKSSYNGLIAGSCIEDASTHHLFRL